jgi:hypothetical protein
MTNRRTPAALTEFWCFGNSTLVRCGTGIKAQPEWFRGRWGIKSRLHRVLDLTLRKDNQRHRVGHSARNLSPIRRPALHQLRWDKNPKSEPERCLKGFLECNYVLKAITQGMHIRCAVKLGVK